MPDESAQERTGRAAASRRIGAESSATRAALLDAAQQLMLEEGYASVTSRRVAARAGLKPQLVHYYFRTMDDLFLALFRRGAERNLERYARVLDSPHPLRTLWEFASEPSGTRLTFEFSALANHRKEIRAEIAAYAEQFRRHQSEALAVILDRYGVDAGGRSPAALAVLMTAVARILAMEDILGVTTGHAEVLGLIEDVIAAVESGHEPTLEAPGHA